TRCLSDWSSDVCSSDLHEKIWPVPYISERAEKSGAQRNRDEGMILPRNELGKLPRIVDAQSVKAESPGEKREVGRRVIEHGGKKIGRASCRERVSKWGG